jgi:ABC-2 type transport system ATP-binding protein
MITATDLKARHRGAELASVSVKLEAGRHALVGGPQDGGGALLACAAGDVRPKRGTLTVLGGAPGAAATRRRVAYVPLDVTMPDVLRTSELLALAASVRGEDGDPAKALDGLGVASLATRSVRSLDQGELRAALFAEALASKVVEVVLIEEPFVAMAPPAVTAMTRALASPAVAKKCIVIATASQRDATRLADHVFFLERGKLVSAGDGGTAPHVTRIRVLVDDGRALAAALAKAPEIDHLELAEGSVTASGKDPAALAGAINKAIVDASVELVRMEGLS